MFNRLLSDDRSFAHLNIWNCLMSWTNTWIEPLVWLAWLASWLFSRIHIRLSQPDMKKPGIERGTFFIQRRSSIPELWSFSFTFPNFKTMVGGINRKGAPTSLCQSILTVLCQTSYSFTECMQPVQTSTVERMGRAHTSSGQLKEKWKNRKGKQWQAWYVSSSCFQEHSIL